MNNFMFFVPKDKYKNDAIIDGVLPDGGITVISGSNGKRNSQVATDIALCVAHGKDFNGHRVSSKRTILYITASTLSEINYKRALWKHANKELTNDLFSVLFSPINLLDLKQRNYLISEILLNYKNRTRFGKTPSLVVLDIQRLFTDKVKSARHMDHLFYVVNELQKELNTTFLLVFNEGTTERDRGFKKLFSLAKVVHRVEAVDDSYVRLNCTKTLDMDMPTKIDFELTCADSTKGRWV